MVCLGNICRSPLAEGILQKKIKENGLDWEVDSAGTESYHVGEVPHHFSQKVARLNGIDLSCQKARRFTASDLKKFDKIYAMAADVYREIADLAGPHADLQNVDLLLNELYPGEDLSVPDPWYGGESGFHEAYKLIEKACDKIIEKYGHEPSLK